MVAQSPMPTSLKVVAGLFILSGAWAVLSIIIKLTHNTLSLNLDVLGLFIGPGLLHFSRGWRTCALVFIWFKLICSPIVALLFLFADTPPRWVFFGQTFGEAPREAAVALRLAFWLIALWEYRVLTRPYVRRLFGLFAEPQI
jgi:hypothetical protein